MFCFSLTNLTLTVLCVCNIIVFINGHGQCTKHVHVDQDSNRKYKSFMRLDIIGVSQCIKICKRYKLCETIHHDRDQLTCDLMMTYEEKGDMPVLDDQSLQMDSTNCDICSDTQACVETKDGNHVCLDQDVCPTADWVPFNNKCYLFTDQQMTANNTII
ncbi:uncharacterized protein [Argopecten irradians]|uniref:uncharacterized protein n=1 Tax=Argopecten irradians TaxID=31199 RepID=UPI00371AA78A